MIDLADAALLRANARTLDAQLLDQLADRQHVQSALAQVRREAFDS